MLRLSFLLLLVLAVNVHADVFDDWDQDGDGKLVQKDLPIDLRTQFVQVDQDGDGAISREEHNRVMLRIRPPRGYKSKRDVFYADTDNPRQSLDLYLPEAKRDSPSPLLVFVHGGAWRAGNKRSGLNQLRPFLDGKTAGASIGYRLTGEAIWPAQIHDCKAAIRWLKGNAKQLHIDPARIVVFGTSAGGHLVAMLGTTANVVELEGDLGQHCDQDSRVAGVIDFFGPSDLLSMGQSPALDHDAQDSPESKLVGGTLQKLPAKAQSASPTTHVTMDDAAFFIAHGDQDRLVPFQQSELLHEKLKASKVSSVLVRMKDGGHGFRHEALTKRMKAFLANVFEGRNNLIPEETIVVPKKGKLGR